MEVREGYIHREHKLLLVLDGKTIEIDNYRIEQGNNTDPDDLSMVLTVNTKELTK